MVPPASDSGRRPPASDAAVEIDPAVGLCSACASARVQSSAKGSAFYRCLKADTDERFLQYPPLPVRRCLGFENRAHEPD